jgi:hypothetical protein
MHTHTPLQIMTPIAFLLVLLTGCASASRASNAASFGQTDVNPEAQLIELADSVFSAARARNADRFASYFLDRPGFVYLINKRQLNSVAELRNTFASMLARQRLFEPRWGNRRVQMINPTAGIFTGEFATKAERSNGEAWGASGIVTFVAVREAVGWRVMSWHTSE